MLTVFIVIVVAVVVVVVERWWEIIQSVDYLSLTVHMMSALVFPVNHLKKGTTTIFDNLAYIWVSWW